MNSIWILNHHADENGHRHYELGREFALMGYNVIVVASSFNHSSHTFTQSEEYVEHKISENFSFVYLRTTPAYSKNGMKRILNMFDYVRLLKKYAVGIAAVHGKPDFVIGSCVHPLAWEAAYWASNKFEGKFICEVRDFWPLSLIEINGTSKYHPLVLFFAMLERRAYTHAAKIVTTFPYGYKYICDDMGYPKDKVVWIPNGIRISQEDSAIALPEDLYKFLCENWCCIYTGSFVQSECVDFLIDVFAYLRDSDVYFAIVGSGQEQEKLERKIAELSLNKVRIFPQISKPQVAVANRMAKCCLAALNDYPIYRFGLSMNKLNDYLLSGNPVIFACSASNPVKEAEHISLPFGDARKFAQAVIRVRGMSNDERSSMAVRGQKLIGDRYDYAVIAKEYIRVLIGQ